MQINLGSETELLTGCRTVELASERRREGCSKLLCGLWLC